MSETKLTIHPVDLGTLVAIDKSIFTLRHNQGIAMDVPCLAFLVLGGPQTVLVDTGPCSPKWAETYHRPLAKRPEQEVPAALGRFGVAPQDVDLVIWTHLHWDHCFNLEHFPKAAFVLQKRELTYAVAPLPVDAGPYEAGIPGIHPPWMAVYDRIRVIDGDVELFPGLKTLLLPGHTPGFQGVAVETESGPWVIAGDSVPLYENWEVSPPGAATPGGIYQDLFAYFDSLTKLKIFQKHLLPGHDARVLSHDAYPAR